MLNKPLFFIKFIASGIVLQEWKIDEDIYHHLDSLNLILHKGIGSYTIRISEGSLKVVEVNKGVIETVTRPECSFENGLSDVHLLPLNPS